MDPVRAAAGPFGATVAHGYLTLSLLPQLLASALEVADTAHGCQYGLDRLRFPAPVPAGSRLRGTLQARQLRGACQVARKSRLEVTMELEGVSKPACVAFALTRLYS